MAKIVSLGSALQDIYLIDHDDLVPTEIGETAILGKVLVGSKVDIDRISYETGGGGLNSSIAFARCGHQAVFLGNVAHDPAGEAIAKKLSREGVDASHMESLERCTTGTSIILLDSKSGERTILTCRGASVRFENLSERVLDEVEPDWLYVTTLRGDMETLKRFFRHAEKNNIKIMFNPGVKELEKPEELMKLLKYVSILNLNKEEAAKLVSGSSLTELLHNLRNYVNTVIITDGPRGGIAANEERAYQFGIYEDRKVKDATGAGDAFGSGFLASIAAGKSFKHALIFASANSTSVVSCLGANKGILTGNEELHEIPMHKTI